MVTQAVKVYKVPKDRLVFLVDLEHKALLELLVCLELLEDQEPPDLLDFQVSPVYLEIPEHLDSLE